MRRGVPVLLLALAAAVPWSAGCGDCARECPTTATDAEPAVEGTVIREGEEIVQFRFAGQDVDVRVAGEAAVLEAGATYLVPLRAGVDGAAPTAALPEDCDCGGPYITAADGAAVEIDEGLPEGLHRVFVLTLAGFGAVVFLWGGGRWLRGRPLF